MAKKEQSTYKVDTENKKVILYKGMKRSADDMEIIGLYVAQGYKAISAEKKETVSVEDMKAKLKKNDKDKYDEFCKKYDEKDFHGACAVYSEWEEAVKVAKMREELEADKENEETEKALNDFNKAYAQEKKKGKVCPYRDACKIYNAWKKEQKAKAEE